MRRLHGWSAAPLLVLCCPRWGRRNGGLACHVPCALPLWCLLTSSASLLAPLRWSLQYPVSASVVGAVYLVGRVLYFQVRPWAFWCAWTTLGSFSWLPMSPTSSWQRGGWPRQRVLRATAQSFAPSTSACLQGYSTSGPKGRMRGIPAVYVGALSLLGMVARWSVSLLRPLLLK